MSATLCLIAAIATDSKLLEQLQVYLTERGYALSGFSQFADELEEMYQQEHIPDIILLALPKAEVLAASKQLHQDPSLSLIPLILLLEHESDFTPEELIRVGAADFLVRPFDTDQLLALIKKHQLTYQKWWQTFHVEGPQPREQVRKALAKLRYQQQELNVAPAKKERADDFQHFKYWLHRQLKLSSDWLDHLDIYGPDDMYTFAEKLGLSSIQMATGISRFLHLETSHDLQEYTFASGLIPFQFCIKNQVIPLHDRFSRLHIALANPFKLEVVDILNRLFKTYHLIIVAPELILEILDPQYAHSSEFDQWKVSLKLEQRRRALFTHTPPLSMLAQPAEHLSEPPFTEPSFTEPPIPTLAEENSNLITKLVNANDQVASEKIAAEMERRLLSAYQAYREQKNKEEAKSTSAALNHLMDGKAPEVAPIIFLVNSLIEKAVLMQASDIHIEPTETEVIIRYRIDGTLRVMHRLSPRAIILPIIARLKIMSNLDITEKRLPQDGRVHFIEFSEKQNTDIDIRLSIVPLQYGEKAVMRLLDHSLSILSLEKMGFSKEALELYRQKLRSPYGMILHVGPTGSGKTTTLYSAMNELNSPELNIHTIEDPIEYTLPGLNQLEVRHQIGLTFARVLRAYLRQDPDVILVGEIRDDETAHISLEAAMTGHMLLSTLHTNDAASTVTRLLEMGMKPYMLTASLLMICAQRLLRRLCPECKEPYSVSSEIKQELGLPLEEELTFYHAKGCKECDQLGYRGRAGVYELLIPSSATRKLMNQANVTAEQIKQAAVEQDGMKTLFQDGLDKVRQGVTSLEELTMKILPD